MVARAGRPEGRVEIALVGKYTALHDAYLSVAEALTHAGIANGVGVDIRWVDAEQVTGERAAGLEGAHSSELGPTPYPVSDLMSGQRGGTDKGGTMRLGACPCRIGAAGFALAAYGAPDIRERHRHRYEFNNQFRDALREKGLKLSGLSPDGRLVEIVELADHPWFVGVQFHPEFQSRPNRAHPLFRDFIAAAKRHSG